MFSYNKTNEYISQCLFISMAFVRPLMNPLHSPSSRRNPPRRARPSIYSPGPSTKSGLRNRKTNTKTKSSSKTDDNDECPTPASPEVVVLHSTHPPFRVDNSFVEVFTNVQIFRLQKIDSSSEEYCLDVGLTFIWEDPKLVPQIGGQYFSTHPSIVTKSLLKHVENVMRWPDELRIGEDTFDPAWKILNSSDVTTVKSITTVLDSDKGKVHNFVHVRATIDQSLDLHDFPFDKQKLQLRLQSEHPSTCMKFSKFPDREPKIFAGDNSEWMFRHDTLPKIKLFNPNTIAAASGVSYAAITAEFYALRKPEWYMWNVVFTSFSIVASSFSLFFLEEEAKGDRLNLLFTTWLMLISLKFIISDRLPKISYFSALDYYITFSYIVMVFLIIHVCTNEDNGRVNYFKVSSLKEPDMFVFVSTIWIFVHAIVLWKYQSSNGWKLWKDLKSRWSCAGDK